MNSKKPLIAAAVLAAAALALVGCSSKGGASSDSAAFSSLPGKGLTIAMVTHQAPGDTFWDIVRKGAEAAAKVNGAKLLYASDPDGSKQAQLVQQYTEQKVNGIAVTLAKPEDMQSAVEGAVSAGIPVTALNAGLDNWKAMGIESYFGSDEDIAGQAVGQKLKDAGLSHPICVVQEQGNVSLQTRCAGIQKVLPSTEILYVDGTNNSQVLSTVTAKLQADKSADSIVGLGAPYTVVIEQAVKAASSSVKIASFDLNAQLATDIKSGTVLFTVDQQPWLQGYEAVEALILTHEGQFVMGGGQPVLTGPAIVDKANVDAVLKGAEEGIR